VLENLTSTFPVDVNGSVGDATDSVVVNHQNRPVGAQTLHALNQSADETIRKSAEHQEQTGEFAQQAKSIKKAAREKNIDGATLAYFGMTLSCVSCHRHMRGSEQASALADETIKQLPASLKE
jgi:cytochrome c556